MDGDIGADVERMQQLAAALEDLRDVLAANVPKIVNTMNEYWSAGTGQPISLIALQQALASSADDASAIRARANLAVAYQDQNDVGLHGKMVTIPWDTSVPPAQAALEYQEGLSAARKLNGAPVTLASYEKAVQLLANKAGNPSYIAGYLRGLNSSSLTDLINVLGVLPKDNGPVSQAIVTAMIDGKLDRTATRELAKALAARPIIHESGTELTPENVALLEFYAGRDQLLQDIAKNTTASAHFVASTEPAQLKALFESFDPNTNLYCPSYSGVETILQIMTNAVDSKPPPKLESDKPPAAKLIASLGGDLQVLNAQTLSQPAVEKDLKAFMTAAVIKLTPPMPGSSNQAQLAAWSTQLRQNMESLAPLLASVGTSYENYQQSVHFLQSFLADVLEDTVTGALGASVSGPGPGEALGLGEGITEGLLQGPISKGMNYLIPDDLAGGAQAQISAHEQLQEITMIYELMRLYQSAGDVGGLKTLMTGPNLWTTVRALATGGKLTKSETKWLERQTVPVSGDPDFPLTALLGSLAQDVPLGTLPSSSVTPDSPDAGLRAAYSDFGALDAESGSQKLVDDQPAYREAARAAGQLGGGTPTSQEFASMASYEKAVQRLASEAGNPDYIAGFFSGLSGPSLSQFVKAMMKLGRGRDTARIWQGLTTAMGDGKLDRTSMSKVANMLGSTGVQQSNDLKWTANPLFPAVHDQLLEDIAKNPAASKRFIGAMNSAQIKGILWSFDPSTNPFCQSSSGIEAMLQIMTNAVNSEPLPKLGSKTPPAAKLIASLSSDLQVVNAQTLSQPEVKQQLAGFMKLAVEKVTPTMPPNMDQQQLAAWSTQLRQNMQALLPLLESTGTAFQNYQQNAAWEKGFLSDVLWDLLPSSPQMGTAEGIAEGLTQNDVSKLLSYLVPDNLESGPQAQVSAQQQLQEITMNYELTQLYPADDPSGLKTIMTNPNFAKSVRALATGGKLSESESKWLDSQTIPISGDPNFPLTMLFGMLNLDVPLGQVPPD